MHFVILNDLHYQSPACGEWLERVVRQINSEPDQPEFAVVLGDLAEEGTRDQLQHVRGILDELAMPWHAVIGNHDYAAGDDRSAWDAVLPEPVNRVVTHSEWDLLLLDTTVGNAYQDTLIPAHTLEWVTEALFGLAPERPKLVLTHFPLGEGVRFRPLNAEDLLRRLQGRNVRAVFSGHYHGTTQTTWRGIPLLTNRCCSPLKGNHDGSEEKGYLLCSEATDRLERRFVEVRTG